MLAAHPEDFQYVEFDVVAHPCVAADPLCWSNSKVTPKDGAPGTSFALTLCCWEAGTRVTKTFTTPSGRTISIDDVARSDQTVPAGWGGDPGDERGTYTVFARDATLGTLVRFVVR